MTSEQIREEHAYAVGVQAALWGRPFPEYLHSIDGAIKAGAANVNYLHRFSALKTAADRYVNTPNNVSIDAYGNADLGTEPVVISVASLREPRWYIVQIGDMFDEIVYNIGGSRGAEPGLFCLTGPDYHGPIPANMMEIKVRTKLAVVANRVFVNSEADIPAARVVQAGIHMLPLSVFQRQGLKYEIPRSDPALPGVRGSRARTASTLRTDRLRDDALSLRERRLRRSDGGVISLDRPEHREGVRVAVSGRGHEAWTRARRRHGGADQRGRLRELSRDRQRMALLDGRRSCRLRSRPCGPPSPRICSAPMSPSSCSIPTPEWTIRITCCQVRTQYVLRFEKDKLPPVSVFWNLSMYDDKEFFVENDFKRYSIGSTTDRLKTDADGSISIYIQHENPGADKQSNWLPAPAGGFNLTMRLYGAESPILDGSYRLPAVTRLE